jgi:Tfp pilus assembly protein PilX
MKHFNRHSRQRGAALITGLVLLAVITLLAVVGMNISNSELASATSEQLRMRAFQAAETGLEHGLIDMKDVGTNTKDPQVFDPVGVTGAPEDEDGNAIDTFTNTITYRGPGMAPGFSGNDYAALHFSVVSEGKSARDTTVANEQGAFTVNNRTGGEFEDLPGSNGAL